MNLSGREPISLSDVKAQPTQVAAPLGEVIASLSSELDQLIVLQDVLNEALAILTYKIQGVSAANPDNTKSNKGSADTLPDVLDLLRNRLKLLEKQVSYLRHELV